MPHRLRKSLAGLLATVVCVSCGGGTADLEAQVNRALDAFADGAVDELYVLQPAGCSADLSLDDLSDLVDVQRSKLADILSVDSGALQPGKIEVRDSSPVAVRLEVLDADGAIVYAASENEMLWTNADGEWTFHTCGALPVPRR